jgi:hypothetical protein
VGGVPRALVLSPSLSSGRFRLVSRRKGLQAGDRSGDVGGPWVEPLRFPAAGLAREGDQLGPGEQFAGQGGDLAPDLVLGEAPEGRFRSPVSLAFRSLHRARRRCRSSRSASWPFFASVAKAVNRWPSMSVNLSCASGCGLSCRTMTRIPAGQPLRSSRPVMSATQALSLPDLPVFVTGRRPRLHAPGDGHADGSAAVALGGQPLEERVRAAAGVGPDQGLVARFAGIPSSRTGARSSLTPPRSRPTRRAGSWSTGSAGGGASYASRARRWQSTRSPLSRTSAGQDRASPHGRPS